MRRAASARVRPGTRSTSRARTGSPGSEDPRVGTPHRLFTVGHSTRGIDELLATLREARIELVVDVRRYPGSRRHPQFGREALEQALIASGFRYRHEIDLGGRREPREDSPNRAWRVEAFRGYADHMSGPAFKTAFERVLQDAIRSPTAVMCAEAHPSRCHRRLISDLAVLHGWSVVHLLEPGRSEDHAPHPQVALDSSGTIVYRLPKQEGLDF